MTSLAADQQAARAVPQPASSHRAVLDRYCVTCHSDRLRTASLSLEKIDVARGLFLPAASPHHLMCLLGLNGIISRNWQGRIYAVSYETVGPRGRTREETTREYRETIYDLLKEVCGTADP